MNKKRLTICLSLAIMLCLLIVPMIASAKTTLKQCSGKEILIQPSNPGVWTSPDGNIHVRGMVSKYEEQMNCPEVSGINTVVMNANWDAYFTGPMWGTNRLETPFAGGGTWKGTWSGKLNSDGTMSYTGTSKGVSGSVVGLILKVHGCTNEPDGPTFVEITIRDPGDN